MKHFICTRNRYPSGHPRLTQRVELLRQLTLPGLRAQSSQSFEWLLNGDEGLTPDDLAGLPVTVVADFRAHIRRFVDATGVRQRILMTCLDNDDFLLADFVSTLQDQTNVAESEQDMLIDAAGYRYDLANDTLYEDQIYSAGFPSPFLSTAEWVSPGQEFRGAFIDLHRQMHKHFPVLRVARRLWVQTLHDSNRLNGQADLQPRRSRKLGPIGSVEDAERLRTYALGSDRIRSLRPEALAR